MGLEKEYDKVNRERFWKVTSMCEVGRVLLSAAKHFYMQYSFFNACKRINSVISIWFAINTGVCQD